MQSVLVTGGTGQLGREVVRLLRSGGHLARVASRAAAPAGTPTADWATVDYVSGAGLLDALSGVQTVVHSPGGGAKGEQQSMATLLEAVAALVVPPHIVYISIVGVDRIPMGYYRAKFAAEEALRRSGLPFTILRATQFHSLVLGLIQALDKLPVLLVPRGLRVQPIDVTVVAERLVELAFAAPAGRVADIGGPEVRDLADLVRVHLTAAGRSKRLLRVPLPGRIMSALRGGAGITPAHARSGPTFEEYLGRNRVA